MTDDIQPIRTISLSKQAAMAKKILVMAEKTLAFAATPDQLDRMTRKVERMRAKRDDLVARARRLEGYDG